MPLWASFLFGGLFSGLPLLSLGGFLRTGIAGFWGTVAAGLLGVVAGVFVGVGVAVVTGSPALAVATVVAVALVAMIADVYLERHPVCGPARRTRRERNRIIRRAQRTGRRSVVIDGVSVAVPSRSSGSSGGVFRGGGGSSGGGGASGSW